MESIRGMASPLEVVLLLEQVLLSSLFPAVEVVPPVGVMPPWEVATVLEAEPPLEVGSPVAVVPPLDLAGELVAGAMRDLALLLKVEAWRVVGERCVNSSC